MNTEYLKEFEELNITTENVFELGESGLLVILKDGTNLTCWSDVSDLDDVLYISEDLSKQEYLSWAPVCKNVKVIIIQNYDDPTQFPFLLETGLKARFNSMHSLKAFYALNWDTSDATDMGNMFSMCYSLEYVFLEDWDTSNVESFWGMFIICCNLKTLEGVENFDLSSAVNMESMFESCLSLEDISFASDWDMSNVENVFEMFRDCYSLKDASCLNWEFGNLSNGDNIFINCNKLEKLPEWYDDDFRGQFGIRKYLEIADDSFINKIINGFDRQDIFAAVGYIKDEEILKELISKGYDVEFRGYSDIRKYLEIADDSFIDKIINGFDEQDIFVAVGYIKDEEMLKELINSSTHYYPRRAALLNPNLKDTEILERYAVNSNDFIERCYAIENPNFKNAKLLKRISENDEDYLVRFKAKLKLKEMLYREYGISNE